MWDSWGGGMEMYQGRDQSSVACRKTLFPHDQAEMLCQSHVHSDHPSITAQNNLNFNTSEALKRRRIYTVSAKVKFLLQHLFTSNLFLAFGAISSWIQDYHLLFIHSLTNKPTPSLLSLYTFKHYYFPGPCCSKLH